MARINYVFKNLSYAMSHLDQLEFSIGRVKSKTQGLMALERPGETFQVSDDVGLEISEITRKLKVMSEEADFLLWDATRAYNEILEELAKRSNG